MSRLALHLFGSPHIKLDGKPIDIRRRKAIALIAYLAMTGQSHSRDALATLFWSELDQSRARAGLRRALTALRKALGESFLDVDRETVGLNRDADIWLDVAEFQDRLAECRTHGHPEDVVCPDCLSLLAEAAALYCDDFLTGFTLPDSPGFDEWQFFQSEGLRSKLASVLKRLARAHSSRGEFDQAIAYARRWLVLDPLHEPAHRHLMALYAQSGQRSAALRQYGECERVLREELGVSPEVETVQLYEAVEENRELPVPAVRVSPQPIVRKHNLPVQLTPFVGREEALAVIKDRLQDRDCRLLTLIGPGGSGKTRLALEAAAAQLDNCAHGVFFVSLAPLQSAEAIVPTVAEALGFRFYEESEPRQQLLDYLRRRSMLLILDNFEHLLVGAELVTDILKTAPEVKILTTSRGRLNVGGEHRFQITGMDFPKLTPKASADAVQYSAVKLFLQGARRAQPGFELTDENLRGVIDLCRVVEGMPLAIRLAAAWVETLTPQEIAAEISQGIDLLETDLRDVPERQRSMRAVFDHSWNLLTMREREVFEGLSVFRGGFTREAAQRVTGATLRELRALADKSLLQRMATLRYQVHELLRQYAAEKLEASGGTDAARDAHSAYYAEFLHQREGDLEGRRQLAALDEIEAEFDSARAAWNWALGQGNYAAIGQLLNSLTWFCTYRTRSLEHAELFEQAWARLAPGPDDVPHPVWARILAAEFYARSRDVDRAQIERSLAIAQADGNSTLATMCTRILGEIAFEAGDYAEALRLYEESLAYFRDSDYSFYEAATLYELAETYRLMGQPDRALEYARQSLHLSREIGDNYWAARSLANTGIIAFYTGNYTEAEGYLQEANAIYREMGYIEGIASTDVDLGKLAHIRGNRERGKALAEEALGIAEDIGSKRIAESARYALLTEILEENGDEHPADGGLPFRFGRVGRLDHQRIRDEYPGNQDRVPTPDLPTSIDQYKVRRLLATGVISTVYLAEDPHRDRDVILKVGNQDFLNRWNWASKGFRRAAETLATLTHPAITECYGYVETDDRVYLALELIDGKDLHDIIEEQKGFLPEKDVIHWAVQICEVLAYLHSRRPMPIIHRDIKPGNVMIDSSGQVRLLEFTIAESYRPGRLQSVIGTGGYAPPEQYFGYSDARSDVYALGATLHHLLTRRDPTQERPFTFQDAPPRSLNPAISEELAAMIMKAVEHNPEDRYQSAEEMKAALLACL
jgi:predicted ATPase/DNA-binding SARP family transcriptional activator